MVKRVADTPTTLSEKLRAQRQATEDLARAQGHGSTALRDAAGNTIAMNAAAPYPLLRPVGVDAAVAFAVDGTVKMVSPDTQEDRDLTARDLAVRDVAAGKVSAAGGATFGSDVEVTGHVGVVGLIEADNMGTKKLGAGNVEAASMDIGRVHIDDAGIATPGVAAGGTVGAARFRCGAVNIDPGGIAAPGLGITTDPNGAMYSKVYYGGEFRGVYVNTSSQETKTDVRDVSGLLAAVSSLTWKKFRYTDEADGGFERTDTESEYLGPMAEDMARIPALADFVRHDDDGTVVGYDVGSLVGALGKALAELSTEVARLRAQVEKKPKATYPWEPGWSPLPR